MQSCSYAFWRERETIMRNTEEQENSEALASMSGPLHVLVMVTDCAAVPG
jgi:hypothetical protein